jgi:hypothetical protein
MQQPFSCALYSCGSHLAFACTTASTCPYSAKQFATAVLLQLGAVAYNLLLNYLWHQWSSAA